MSIAIVQHKAGVGSGNGSAPGSVTLTSAPTAGNRIFAFLNTNINISSLTYNTSSWEILNTCANLSQTGKVFGTVLVRTVQVGDIAALPNFCTAGATYWCATVYEISGLTNNSDVDVLAVDQQQPAAQTVAINKLQASAAGSLALCGYAMYNGNANPVITGSGWTQDEVGSNFANWGNYGCASYPLASAGDVGALSINFQSNGGSGSPVMVVLLTPSTPSAGNPIVRQTRLLSGTTAFGAFTLKTPPVVGNLLIVFLDYSNGGSNPGIGSGWTTLKQAKNGSNAMMTALGRYVVSGDRTALPAIGTTGTFSAMALFEIEGVNGTFAQDIQISDSAFIPTTLPATSTTTSETTAAANEIVLSHFANYNGTTLLTSSSSGYDFVQNTTNSSDFGSWGTLRQKFASSGATVQSTISWSTTSNPASWIQLVIGAANPAIPILNLDTTPAQYRTRSRYASENAQPSPSFPLLTGASYLASTKFLGYQWIDSVPNALAATKILGYVWLDILPFRNGDQVWRNYKGRKPNFEEFWNINLYGGGTPPPVLSPFVNPDTQTRMFRSKAAFTDSQWNINLYGRTVGGDSINISILW